jgi:hypothetical protein
MKTQRPAEGNTVMAEYTVSRLSCHIQNRVEQYFAGTQFHTDIQEISAFACSNSIVNGLASTSITASISAQEIREAVQVWTMLPEQSRMLCLNHFKEKAEENDPQKIINVTFLFCKVFISVLIPVLSLVEK